MDKIVEFDYTKIVKEGIPVECITKEQRDALLKWGDSIGATWYNEQRLIGSYHKLCHPECDTKTYYFFKIDQQSGRIRVTYSDNTTVKSLSYDDAVISDKKEFPMGRFYDKETQLLSSNKIDINCDTARFTITINDANIIIEKTNSECDPIIVVPTCKNEIIIS
jgi:hypothetical protein